MEVSRFEALKLDNTALLKFVMAAALDHREIELSKSKLQDWRAGRQTRMDSRGTSMHAMD